MSAKIGIGQPTEVSIEIGTAIIALVHHEHDDQWLDTESLAGPLLG